MSLLQDIKSSEDFLKCLTDYEFCIQLIVSFSGVVWEKRYNPILTPEDELIWYLGNGCQTETVKYGSDAIKHMIAAIQREKMGITMEFHDMVSNPPTVISPLVKQMMRQIGWVPGGKYAT